MITAHIGYYIEEKKSEYKHTAVLYEGKCEFFKTGDPEIDLVNAIKWAEEQEMKVKLSRSIKEYDS